MTATEAAAAAAATSSSSSSLFHHKTMLAPMVRVSNVAFRALCADCGADVVFTEEVVAAKLCKCRREVVVYGDASSSSSNNKSVSDGVDDTTAQHAVAALPSSLSSRRAMAEYVVYEPYKKTRKRTVVLATPARDDNDDAHVSAAAASCNGGCGCSSDNKTSRVPVILQLGVADAATAAAAVRLCARDIDGVDLNMGCPKKFSVRNGFGAALMAQPARAGGILRSMHDALCDAARRRHASHGNDADSGSSSDDRDHATTVYVSLKTRLCDSVEATVQMLRAVLVAAGHTRATPCVHAITLHARTRDARSEQVPRYDMAADVRACCARDALFDGVCFVLNGSLASRDDGDVKRRAYGYDAVMLARAALCDATCFATARANDTATTTTDTTTNTTTSGADDVAHYMHVLRRMLCYAVYYRTPFAHFKYHLTRMCPCVPALQPAMPRVQQHVHNYADCCDWLGVPAVVRAQLATWLAAAAAAAAEQQEQQDTPHASSDDDAPVMMRSKRHCTEQVR